jgi:mitochondrial fission protein ELM1
MDESEVVDQPNSKYRCWIISDGRVGRRNQCIGVAQKLGAAIDIIKIADIEKDGGLKEHLEKRLGSSSRTVNWPDIVLSSGDESGNYALQLKQLSANKVFIATITTHRKSIEFNFTANHMIQPFRPCAHSVDMVGVPHKVTPEFIQNGMDQWRFRMDESIIQPGKPIVSALIGGDVDKNHMFNMDEAREFGTQINREVKRLGASLLITNSPRITVPVWRELLATATQGIDQVYVHDCRAKEGNPFAAMLGFADVIAVTGDSLSMCSEACATGKPVYIIQAPSITPEPYKKVHQALYEMGLAKPFEGRLDPYEIKAPPLDEAGKVADAIAPVLDKHRATQINREAFNSL